MAVFISYNHRDNEFAERLSLEIIRENIKVWKDSWRIGVGDSLIGKIQSGLEGADFLCVILSKNSIESAWVKKELNAAFIREIEESKITILPVVIDEVEVPELLRDRICADFRDGFDSAMVQVLARLLPTLQGPPQPTDKAFNYNAILSRVEGDRLIVDIYIVSFDLDEGYCVLTLFKFSGTELSKSMVAEMSPGEIVELILQTCSDRFGYQAERFSIIPTAIRRAEFTICDAEGGTLFKANIESMIMGDMKRGALVFNVAALFSQLGAPGL